MKIATSISLLAVGLLAAYLVSQRLPDGAAPEGEATPPAQRAPLFGGQVILHVSELPTNLNAAINGSAVTQGIQYEIHETLLLRDWESTKFVPNVAKAWHTEDLVLLTEDAPPTAGEIEVQVYRSDEDRTLIPRRVVYGSAQRDGNMVRVSPSSPGSDLPETAAIPARSVERIDEASVLTFELREGVRWQPSLVLEGDALAQTRGQVLDAQDVFFSWSIHSNPDVNCGAKRSSFEAIPGCRVVDERTVRFFAAGQSAFTFQTLGDSLTLLPSHIYNLTDPDCPQFDGNASQAARAAHINVNDHNRLWVGLGPYQITALGQESVEARRFVDESGAPAYFDVDSRPGFIDEIRWRLIEGRQQALMALLNEDVHFVQRLAPDDYFGEATNNDSFKAGFRKGSFYLGSYSFVCWNMHSPKLKDLAVRTAIAHAFDVEGYLRNQNRGLGQIMTGPLRQGCLGYPEDARHHAYDLDLAQQMLEDAGWYDHNGDGIADKDGVELEIELLFPAGSETFKVLARTLQDALRPLGVSLDVKATDYKLEMTRLGERRFEAGALVWFTALESDPEQLWHSKTGKVDATGSFNFAGVEDEEIDRLIARIQRETDEARREELWTSFHNHIYQNVQPYLFGLNAPVTYAASNKIHGIEPVTMTPGYVLRDWHYTDPSVEGVRATLAQRD